MQNLRHSLAPGILDKFSQPVLVLEYFSQILPWSPGPCDLSKTIFLKMMLLFSLIEFIFEILGSAGLSCRLPW